MQKNIWLITIWHTGTQYFKEALEQAHGRISYTHLNDRALINARQADLVYTTFRPPMQVAASWANRGRFDRKQGEIEWCRQWALYAQLLKLRPIVLDVAVHPRIYGLPTPSKKYSKKDILGAHAALNSENFDYFYKMVPKYLIDNAVTMLNNRIF